MTTQQSISCVKNHDRPDGRGVSGVNVAQRCKSVSQLSFWREARRLQQSVSQPMNEAHDRVSEMNGTINPSLATNIAVTHLIFVLHEVLFFPPEIRKFATAFVGDKAPFIICWSILEILNSEV